MLIAQSGAGFASLGDDLLVKRGLFQLDVVTRRKLPFGGLCDLFAVMAVFLDPCFHMTALILLFTPLSFEMECIKG
jgi:hypothetical protein